MTSANAPASGTAPAPAAATDEERIRLHEVLSDDHGLTFARAKKLHGAILAAGFRLAPEKKTEISDDEFERQMLAFGHSVCRPAASPPASTPANELEAWKSRAEFLEKWADRADAHAIQARAQGMRDAANICGTLAETAFSDGEKFEVATTCEAAIHAAIPRQSEQEPSR